MFARIVVIAISVLPFLAAASPTPQNDSRCKTGTLSCCNSNQQSFTATIVKGLLPIPISGVNTPAGVTCSPIDTGSVGNGGSCNAQTACCENVQGDTATCSSLNIN